MDELQKVGKAAMNLAQNENVLNKTSNIFSMLFPYAGLEKKALDMYIEDVEKSNMPSESKLIAILNAKDTIKKIKNKNKIAKIAMDNAKTDTDFSSNSKVNKDWLERFMDSAGYVSIEEVQLVWGKVLSKEFECPGSTPLNMIRILSEITPEYAQAFIKICSMQVIIIQLNEEGNIIDARKQIVFPYSGNESSLRDIGLTFNIINELETLGLIKFNSISGYVTTQVNGKTVLSYVDEKVYHLTEYQKNEIPVGNILLTSAGECLKQITSIHRIDGYSDMYEQYMNKKATLTSTQDYEIIVNENEIQLKHNQQN